MKIYWGELSETPVGLRPPSVSDSSPFTVQSCLSQKFLTQDRKAHYLIDDMSVGVHQLRLSMEGSYEYRFASGTWFNPLVEVALRHDGGDGETGTGVELGGGFLYEDPNLGLSVSGRGRACGAQLAGI